MTKRKVQVADLAYAFAFIIGAAFLLWKAKYGFASYDEALYLSIPLRLCKGDAMLFHEQHIAQLFSFLLYPVVKLYTLLVPSTEGVCLNFRYLFCLVQCIVSLLMYLLLRRRNAMGAALSSIFLLLYAPFDVMALSYYSLGVICLSLSMALLYSSFDRAPRVKNILAGVCFAGAVLCCPFLLILYVIYTIAMLAQVIHRKRSGAKTARNLPPEGDTGYAHNSIFQQWLFVSLGAAVLAIAFFTFLFSRASVADILRAIPQVLNDPHSLRSFPEYFTGYVKEIIGINEYSGYFVYGIAAFLLVFFLDRNRRQRSALYFFAAALLSGAFTILLLRHACSSFLVFPANLLGLVAFFLQSQRDRRAFFCFWIPGMAYSFLLNAGSDQGYYAISSGSAVALIGSILLISGFLHECFISIMNKAHPSIRKIGSAVTLASGAAVICIVFTTMIQARSVATFWDDAVMNLNAKIPCGAEAGILTSEAQRDAYLELYRKTSGIREEPEGIVLYISKKTWPNLDDKKQIGAYSAWIATYSATEELVHLADYYSLCPEKTPDFIFIDPEMHDVPEAENLLISSGAYRWKGAAGERYLERVKGMAFPIDAVRSTFAVG